MEPSGLAESPSGFTARKAATWVNANHPDGRSKTPGSQKSQGPLE
jgi:hypothetical protein